MGGMLGVGSAATTPVNWAEDYSRAKKHMPAPGALAIGTDANGFEPLPHRYGQNDDENERRKMWNVSSAKFYRDFSGNSRPNIERSALVSPRNNANRIERSGTTSPRAA